MDIRKHKAFLKVISLIVVVSFLSFDIAWAYPTRVPQMGQKLNVESPFQADLMGAKKKEFQESLFADAKLRLSVSSIAKFLLEDEVPLRYLAKVLERELGTIREGIDLSHVTRTEDGVILVPYANGGKKWIIQIAQKGGLPKRELAGYKWVVNDKYVMVALPEGYSEKRSEKTQPEKEPEITITEPILEEEVEIEESLDQKEPSKLRKLIIKAIHVAPIALFFIVLTPLIANAGVTEVLTSSNIYSWLFYGYIFCFFHGFINMMIAHEGENFRTHGIREKIDEMLVEKPLEYIFGSISNNKGAMWTGMLIFTPLIGFITIPITIFSLLNIFPIKLPLLMLKGLDRLIFKLDERRLSHPFEETIEEMRRMSPSRILNRKGVLGCILRCEREMAGCGFSIFEYDTQYLTEKETETIADEVMKVTRKQGKIKKLLRKLLSNVVKEESKTHIEYGTYVHKGGPSDVGSRYVEDTEDKVVDSKGKVKVVFDWAEFEMIKSKFQDKSALSETSPDDTERAAKKSKKVTLAGILEGVRYLEKYHLVGWHILRLGSKNYQARDKAVAKLAKIGELAVEPLIGALKHENVLVRIGAARALGLIGSAEAVDPLIDLLLMDKLSYYSAATALAAIGDRKALVPLIETLGRCPLVEIPGVRNFIEKRADESSVEHLTARLDQLTRSDFNVNRFIIDLLRKIKDKRATGSLARLIKKESELATTRQRAAEALLEIGDPDLLKKEFGDEYRSVLKAYTLIYNEGLSAESEKKMVEIGRPAVPVLIFYLPEEKPSIASALGKIKDERVVEPMIDILRTRKKKDLFEQCVIGALANIGDMRAFGVLVERAEDEFKRGWHLLPREGDPTYRLRAGGHYTALAEYQYRTALAPALSKFIPIAIEKGDSRDKELLRKTLRTLIKFGLDAHTGKNGSTRRFQEGKLIRLSDQDYERIIAELVEMAMQTGSVESAINVIKEAVIVDLKADRTIQEAQGYWVGTGRDAPFGYDKTVEEKEWVETSPAVIEYGHLYLRIDWDVFNRSIENEISKAESARREEAEGTDKDDTHTFKAQDGFEAVKIVGSLFLLGVAGLEALVLILVLAL